MFQFTHPGRGATRRGAGQARGSQVSIHAPREGCDIGELFIIECSAVSIHAPREGCDRSIPRVDEINTTFQFTHPGRGATTLWANLTNQLTSFNSRTPGGVRLAKRFDVCVGTMFQFTHPGRGATGLELSRFSAVKSFNSRTPGGVRLHRKVADILGATVSIHAPREGCDADQSCSVEVVNVSIHAPREGCD